MLTFLIQIMCLNINFFNLGLLNQPKWGHLKELHAAIKLCEPAVVAVDSPQYIKLGPMQEVGSKSKVVWS